MKSFEEGYSLFVKSSAINSELANPNSYVGYIGDVEQCIETLVADLNRTTNSALSDKPAPILKGDIAEFFHADTFNLSAVINNSKHRANVDRSNKLGSVDISTNFEKNFSLKYYRNAEQSATEQAKSIWERYLHYSSKHPDVSIEEYLERNNIPVEAVISESLYRGQGRIIPSDQLKVARDYAQKKALENLNNTSNPDRQAVGLKWQETYKMLDSKIKDNEGVESIELSNKDAQMLAELAKEGKVTADELAKLGVDPSKLITYEHIIKQAFNSALSAILMTTVLQVFPELMKFIYNAISENRLDENDIKNFGARVVCSEGEAFIRGGVSAALTIAFKSGMMGKALKVLTPAQVGAAVVIMLDTIRNTFNCIIGEKTTYEVADGIVKDTIVIAASLVGGAISQTFIHIPVLGYMIGNMIGAVAGTIIYSGINVVTLSFCIDTGFTLFGLVKQDYTLPDEVFEFIGAPIFKSFVYKPKEYKPKEFEPKRYNGKAYSPTSFSIVPLRRGVLSIGKIGYLS